MVGKVIDKEATSIREYIVLPGLTPEDCTPDKIDVSQTILGIHFKFPMIPASMSCLYNREKYDLALAASREGMPPVIHYNQSIDDQVKIILSVKEAKIPEGDIEFIEDPAFASPNDTLASALGKVARYGHSVIPVLNKFRRLMGVFIKPFYEPKEDLSTHLEDLPEPLYYGIEKLAKGTPYISEKRIKKELASLQTPKKEGLTQNFFPLVDREGRLIKFAFVQRFPAYFCGAAISTHEGWKERVKACKEAGADFFVIDTSDGHSEFELKVTREFKNMFPDTPLCGGNWITPEAFKDFVEYVDFAKIGMMTGDACKTGAVKNVGSPLFEPLREINEVRNEYYANKGKKIYLIGDGGILTPPDMTVVLAFFDLMMGGKYFAQFYESAGRGFDRKGNPTDNEELTVKKEYWGEGSNRAKNLARYGHLSIKTSLEEGVEKLVEHRGRLKPNVEEDFKVVRNTMSNAGCRNLEEYRAKVVLRRLSAEGMKEKYPGAS